MNKKNRQLHINVNLQAAGSHPAAWRVPQGNPLAALDISHFQRMAQIAERGLLDAVFLADLLATPTDIGGAPMWALDPVPVVSAMAVATSNIGFILTNSTTFAQPYHLARAMLSLDHISRGRIGWNVVTSYEDRVAGNFGLAALPAHDDRYAMAQEFTEVVLGLWDSWEQDALRADIATGIWGDVGRIHRLDHQGRYFRVAGPLQVPRSPQGRPVLIQAGSSPQGRDFAARYAEAVFTVQQDIAQAQDYYADIKQRAAGYGRDPSRISVLPGISLVIGATEEQARRRKLELDEIAGGAQAGLQRFANRLGVDATLLSLDAPVPDQVVASLAAGGSRGFADAAAVLLRDRSKTVRQLIAAGNGMHRQIVGTPDQIADSMEEWFGSGAADGFNIMLDLYPSGLEDFVDHVVPVLQRRGLFRTAYEGNTLRANYDIAVPANRFATLESTHELQGETIS